jgi:FixJ family two-component response regulator
MRGWVLTHMNDYDRIHMTMPRMTGEKLAKEILKARSDMPIILCTGYSQRMGSIHSF